MNDWLTLTKQRRVQAFCIDAPSKRLLSAGKPAGSHGDSCLSPARVQSLLVFEERAGLQLLFVHGLLLLRELAPVFLALKTSEKVNKLHYF